MYPKGFIFQFFYIELIKKLIIMGIEMLRFGGS